MPSNSSSHRGGAVYGVGTHKPGDPIREKNKRMRRTIIAVLAVVGALVCASVAWAASINKSLSMGEERKELAETLAGLKDAYPESGSDAFYVLLVGSDSTDGDEGSRGDALMLARVDTDARTVTLVSIPSDTLVMMEGSSEGEPIGASLANGGASMAVNEVSRFAGVPVSHYIEIDRSGIERVVDTLGGIWVNLPRSLALDDVVLESGPQLIDGATALAFVHAYHRGNGAATEAYSLIVQAVIRQTLQASPLEMPGLVSSLAACVSTDYSATNLVSLSLGFPGGNITVYSADCPSHEFERDGVRYSSTLLPAWHTMMQRVDAGLDPNDSSSEIPEPQASNEMLGGGVNASPEE